MNGHTHIYDFPPEETHNAIEVIKLHAAEGRLHPQVALILVAMAQ